MRTLSLLFTGFLFLACSTPGTAQQAGVFVFSGGEAVTPSTAGIPLYLVSPSKDTQGQPAYSLVRSGGKAVVIMNSRGVFLAPDEAWNSFYPVPPQSTPPPPKESIFSGILHW